MAARFRLFCAGLLFANSIPHLASGVSGRVHLTPFGRESTPLVNLAWAAGNVAVGCGLVRFDAHRDSGGQHWDSRLLALGAGAASWSVWMLGSEYLIRANTAHK